MAKPRKKKPGLHHPDTQIITSTLGGHNYLVAYKHGHERQAAKMIREWVENPELNLTAADGAKMVEKLQGAIDYQVMIEQHAREREAKKRER